jgi:hypothetical protein
MDKKRILLKNIAKVNPFKTPEGYFEDFTNGIMSQLPDIVREDSIKPNLWYRMRPWIYMAAMFTGLALMIRLFVGSPTSLGVKKYASEGLNLTSLSDIEDFYLYYEEGLAQLACDDVFYLTDYNEETY